MLPALTPGRGQGRHGRNPAQTLVGVTRLAMKHFLVEIEATAVVPE
jgi:enamine deaminase RidA (YjgF/YER057c/UK114 family)